MHSETSFTSPLRRCSGESLLNYVSVEWLWVLFSHFAIIHGLSCKTHSHHFFLFDRHFIISDSKFGMRLFSNTENEIILKKGKFIVKKKCGHEPFKSLREFRCLQKQLWLLWYFILFLWKPCVSFFFHSLSDKTSSRVNKNDSKRNFSHSHREISTGNSQTISSARLESGRHNTFNCLDSLQHYKDQFTWNSKTFTMFLRISFCNYVCEHYILNLWIEIKDRISHLWSMCRVQLSCLNNRVLHSKPKVLWTWSQPAVYLLQGSFALSTEWIDKGEVYNSNITLKCKFPPKWDDNVLFPACQMDINSFCSRWWHHSCQIFQGWKQYENTTDSMDG